jgi:hypothetical protein
MTNVTAITPPARRTPKFSGAMIEHATTILRKGGTDYTHRDDDGYSQVCNDCLVKLLKRAWGSRIRRPLTRLQWEALGHVAQSTVWIEDDLERNEEVSSH